MVKKFNIPRNFGRKIVRGIQSGARGVERVATTVGKAAGNVNKIASTVDKITGNPIVMAGVGALAPELLPELIAANAAAKAVKGASGNVKKASGDVANKARDADNLIERAKTVKPPQVNFM
mgnify:CR=1 FL=1